MHPWSESPGILEETKRVARILDIVARINSRPKVWTRKALAQAFEISERRIQHDLDIIRHRLRLPLCWTPKGYYFADIQMLPAVTFAFGEAVALLLAAAVGRATAGVDSAELAAALSRLTAVFPAELRALVEGFASPHGAIANEHRQRLLEVLHQAVATRTTVRLRYATASRDGEESEREVDPYAIVPYVRSFHLVGYCHLRREVRIFKVDRIRDLRLTGHHFILPLDFDLATYLGEGWGLMRGVAREAETVEILFSPLAGRWVAEEQWHPNQKVTWRDDGGMVFSLKVGVTPPFVRWVLNYGPEAKVLRPAWLAEEVRRQAAATAARYAGEEGE